MPGNVVFFIWKPRVANWEADSLINRRASSSLEFLGNFLPPHWCSGF